jgi:hypothetical protein
MTNAIRGKRKKEGFLGVYIVPKQEGFNLQRMVIYII